MVTKRIFKSYKDHNGKEIYDFTISDLMNNVRELGESKGFKFESERQFIYLVSEIGEIADELLILTAEGSSKEDKEKARERLGSEIFDAIWNLVACAHIHDIDINIAARKKIERNKNREFKPD